ncbi:hypothetical protein AOLI_G00272700 [Acnodon oligacanthus]
MERTAAVAVALMMLLQNSLQDPEVAVKSQDCSAEWKQLRDLVYQQATALAELKVKVSYMEKENTALEARLSGRESEMENLKKENEAVKSDLEKLKMETSATLGSVSTPKNRACGSAVIPGASLLGRPKVAFSAGLPAGQTGPVSAETTLIYSKVLANIGSAYNPYTGTFTAPVRGVYYIRFTAAAYNSDSSNMGLNLYKNDHHVMHLGEYNSDGKARHVSGALALELEAGDVLYARLPANYMLYDDSLVRNSFSGFLIFPMTAPGSPKKPKPEDWSSRKRCCSQLQSLSVLVYQHGTALAELRRDLIKGHSSTGD